MMAPRVARVMEEVNAAMARVRSGPSTTLSPRQQEMARRLADAALSERGRSDLAGTFAVEGRFEGSTLVVYGEPERDRAQVSISGGHFHVRANSRDRVDEPLGGAVSYGHQIGNRRWRLLVAVGELIRRGTRRSS